MSTPTHPSHRSTLRRIASVLSCLALALSLALPARAAERAAVKLLTIGNSFADYPIGFLPALAKAGGKEIVIGRANIGGCSLERHARNLALAEAGNPAGRAYKSFVDPTTGKKRPVTLPEALAAAPWDIVTLQQWSRESFKPETYHPAVDQLIAAIRKYAPQAEIVIQETWSYRTDHPIFHHDDGFTQQKMYDGLRAAYHQLAAETGFRIIPTGDALHLARQTPRWVYVADKNFDFKNPPPGELPDQHTSLNAGWAWRKNKAGQVRFTLDAIHLSDAGRYLGASVWYQVLFNTDTVPDGFIPKSLTPGDAAGLRQFAIDAVKAERAREAAH